MIGIILHTLYWRKRNLNLREVTQPIPLAEMSLQSLEYF